MIGRVVFTSMLSCFIYFSQGQSFTEVAFDSGINMVYEDKGMMGGGCVFFDYDNDGFEDIFVTGGLVNDGLFRNNGDGSFTNRAPFSGIITPDTICSTAVAAGDINNDGCKDLIITTSHSSFSDFFRGAPDLLFLNNCDGTFTNISVTAGIVKEGFGIGATFGDVNLDGFLDIYISNYIEEIAFEYDSVLGAEVFAHIPQQNFLYINNGDNSFTESAALYGVGDNGTTLASAFTDFDQDKDIDLFVSNDFGYYIKPSTLYENQYPANQFFDAGTSTGFYSQIYGMGIAIGDYDNDGDYDYYESNFGRNIFYQNEGNGTFTDQSEATGTENDFVVADSTYVSWGTFFADTDNDSDLDLFVSNGFISSDEPAPLANPANFNSYYVNQGDGTFTEEAAMSSLDDEYIARGAAYSDYDNDGDIDIFSVVINKVPDGLVHDVFGNPLRVMLYRNDSSNGNNWVKIKLQGVDCNRDAFGSKVTIYSSGQSFVREIDGGSSHASHNTTIAHFGLGLLTGVDSVMVSWLGGDDEMFYDVNINEQKLLVQGTSTNSIGLDNSKINLRVYPTLFKNTINISSDEKITFQLYDARGELILEDKLRSLDYELNNLEFLPSGIYFLSFISDDGFITSRKIIKE